MSQTPPLQIAEPEPGPEPAPLAAPPAGAVKPGYKTTEFWVTAATNLVAALLALLVGRGVLVAEESSLVQDLALATIPLVAAVVNAAYIHSRGQVKAAAGR